MDGNYRIRWPLEAHGLSSTIDLPLSFLCETFSLLAIASSVGSSPTRVSERRVNLDLFHQRDHQSKISKFPLITLALAIEPLSKIIMYFA